MASERKFHTNVNSTDIIQQSEDGGGIKLTTDGKFIFGAKHQNIIDQLSDENYTGTVDVNANNQSFIAVMNENSHAIEVNVPVDHFSSLEIPTDNVVTSTQTQPNGQNNNTGCDFTDYFPLTRILPSGEVKIDVLAPGVLSALTSFINHENDYKKLGWGNYGVKYAKDFWIYGYPNFIDDDGSKYPNVPNLKAKINDASNLTFDEALYNAIQLVSDFENSLNDKAKFDQIFANVTDNEIRYVKRYNPQTFQYANPEKTNISTGNILWLLPFSLRIMMTRVIYNSGWISAVSRLLVTTRKVAILKDPQTKLGITEEEGTIGGKDPITGAKLKSLSDTQKLNKYAEQIDDILDLYNSDKTNFLKALKDEFDRQYNKFVDQRKEPNSSVYQQRFKDNEADFRKFYNEYNQIALDEALNVIDCPNQPILMPRSYAPPQTQQTTTTTTPTPPSTTTTPPAPEEEQEGIYEANFLPIVETDYIDLNKGTCSESVTEIVNDILSGKTKVFDGNSPIDEDNSAGDDDVKGNNPAIQANDLDLNEALKFVQLGGKGTVGRSNAKADYDAGRLNPNTVKDIGSAAKACGFKVVITTAKTGHDPGSFHETGWGCDIAIVNGNVYDKGNNPNFKLVGDKLKDALISLGYKWMTHTTPAEASSKTHKCVIWQSAGHYNHLHVSSTIEYPGWNNPNPIKAKWKNLQIDGATGKPK